jgi:hypothetical protein
MTRLALVALLVATPLFAQDVAPVPPAPPAPESFRITGTRIAVGRDVHVARDEEVRDAVVVAGGSAVIDGRVRNGVVVIGGDLTLGPTADVRGDVAIIGGELRREPGSRLLGSVSYASFGDWARFSPVGRWIPRLDLGEFGRWLVLAGTVARISFLAVLMAFVLLVARAPVARVGRAAAAEPVRAALVGLAAEVLFAPLLLIFSVALGITIIGLPIVAVLIPLALATGFIALILGYTAMACRLGEWLEETLGWRGRSAYLATAIGLFLIVGPALLARALGVAPEPMRMAAYGVLVTGVVIEFLAWTVGLGATLLTGFGRWNTTPPPIEVS